MVATRRNPIALLRQALSAVLLAVAIACALPAGDSPAIKTTGSAFSADTADMAVLPARPAARSAVAAVTSEPLMPALPVIRLAVAAPPALVVLPGRRPQSRAPPLSALPAPVSRPRAPPYA